MLNYSEFNYGLESSEDNRTPDKEGWKQIKPEEIPSKIRADLDAHQLADIDHDGIMYHHNPTTNQYRITLYKHHGNNEWTYNEKVVGYHHRLELRKGRVAGTLLGIGGAAALGYHYLKGRGKKAAVAVKKANKEWSTGKKQL